MVADLRQQVDIEFVSKEERGRGGQVLKHRPNPGQLLHTLGVVIFGSQLGTLPYPAQFMQPTPYRLCRDLHTAASLHLQSQRGATPACATPATRTGHNLKDRQ